MDPSQKVYARALRNLLLIARVVFFEEGCFPPASVGVLGRGSRMRCRMDFGGWLQPKRSGIHLNAGQMSGCAEMFLRHWVHPVRRLS